MPACPPACSDAVVLQQQGGAADLTYGRGACPPSSPGVVLAAELNRTLVLPRLLLDGTQHSDAAVTEDTGAQHADFW